MKRTLKHNLAFILAICLAFSGQIFPMPAQAAASENNGNPSPANDGQMPVLRVIHEFPVKAVVINQAAIAVTCDVNLADGLLQGSVGSNLFKQPGSCFALKTAQPIATAKPLFVKALPAELVELTVAGFRDVIQNEFEIPHLPVTAPVAAPLPILSWLSLTGIAALSVLSGGIRIKKTAPVFSEGFILQKLQIMRC